IYTELVPGDKIKIQVLPKGAGSENMGALKMLKPAEGLEGVKDFIIKAVTQAGGNPCPPVIVGVGIGGTMDKSTLLAKKALARQACHAARHKEAIL
ncbi:fumarate hydratase, partial [Bacillus cereus]|uniref:fumarate hydratase n=1 Tax=Bacillus cereus TaxID=1396 RepID=UPI00366C6C7E